MSVILQQFAHTIIHVFLVVNTLSDQPIQGDKCYLCLPLLEIHNWMRHPASMSSTATTPNASVKDMLPNQVRSVDCPIFMTCPFLHQSWSHLSQKEYDANLFNFSCNFEMGMVSILSNHETGTVGQLNVILGWLWFKQLSRKVAIIHYSSWINPPIWNGYITHNTVICLSYRSGSSFQFIGRLIFGWGHTVQNSASPPGCTGLCGSCAYPRHIWYFICLHKHWHCSNSL